MGPESKESPSQPSGSYLYDVLADGARSFPFRGGISSLLGISDGGNGFMKLPPTFHPIGFIRPQRARRGYAIPDLHLSASLRRMSSSPAVQSNELYNSCFEECEATRPETLDEYKEETLAERCNGNDGMERGHLAATAEKVAATVVSRRIEIPGVTDRKVTFHHLSTLSANQPESADPISHERNSSHDIRGLLEEESHSEQHEARESIEIRGSKSQYLYSVDNNDCAKHTLHMNKPEKATSAVISGRMDIPCDDMTIEKALSDTTGIKQDRVGIPGVTDNKDFIHPLSAASEDLSPPASLSDNPDQGMNAQRMTGNLSVREFLRDKQLHCKKSSISSYAIKGKDNLLWVHGEESTISAPLKNNHEKREEITSEAEQAIRTMLGNKLFAGMREDAPLRGTATDSQENGSLSELPRLNGTLAKKSDFKMQNSCVAQHDRDMAGILNTLENYLRQRIDQLRDASKKRPLIGVANLEETEKNREQEQTHQNLLPQQQRIVFVRHSSRRNSAPAAFWERSYLGRFRLRPLR
jgi:hypothetical protein